MRRELSSLEYSVSHSTHVGPFTHEIGYLSRKGRVGSLDCMWGVQHSGPSVFLVSYRKALARMIAHHNPDLSITSLNPWPSDHSW